VANKGKAASATLSPLLDKLLEHLVQHQWAAEFSVLVARAVRRWYSSLSAQSARLLMQAALSDNKAWSKMAFDPLDKIIGILARRLEKDMRVPRSTATVVRWRARGRRSDHRAMAQRALTGLSQPSLPEKFLDDPIPISRNFGPILKEWRQNDSNSTAKRHQFDSTLLTLLST